MLHPTERERAREWGRAHRQLIDIFRAIVAVAKATHAYGSIRTDLAVYGIRRASFAQLSLLRRRHRLSHVGCAFISINNFIFHIFIVIGRPCPSNLWHFMSLLKYIDSSAARVHMRCADARKDWRESAAPSCCTPNRRLFAIHRIGISLQNSKVCRHRVCDFVAQNWISIYSN